MAKKTVPASATTSAMPEPTPSKRPYLKQADVPAASIEDALRVPQAIFDHYGGKPTSPLFVAKALSIDPKGSQIRVLTGAAMAFGFIDGGAQAATISVTELARRISRPRSEGEEAEALREAVLGPRVFRDFLSHYDNSPLPRVELAVNVLEEMGVPRAKAPEVFDRIKLSAAAVGFLQEIKGKQYVSLQGEGGTASAPNTDAKTETGVEYDARAPSDERPAKVAPDSAAAPPVVVSSGGSALAAAIIDDQRRRRVFVTHGTNQSFLDPIKKLLEYGELEAVVSVQRQSVSKPVPDKVLDDMRSCGAAIIHVDAETRVLDKEGAEHVFLNPNVLIEIGAAMAFYGRRFILLVKDGLKLPSNLQGLYEVRYSGDTMDAHATIKLLEAIKDIKNHALPVAGEAESETR